MASFRWTRSDERRMLEVDFEPEGDGYVFYRHRWAPGVSVTAAEREEYLQAPLESSRSAFYRKLAGREPVRPRRRFRTSYGLMLEAFPASFGWTFLALGVVLLVNGFVAQHVALKGLFLLAGAMAAAFGPQILIVQWWRGRAGRRAQASGSRSGTGQA